jgi:hypothetical protein
MREVIDLRENRKAYGQYFSGELLRKNGSINRVKTNNRQLQAERKKKPYDRVCKRKRDRQNYRPR